MRSRFLERGESMSQQSTERIEILYSYAQEDQEYQNHLEKHLKRLQREGTITLWHKYNITAGGSIKDELQAHLNSAHIILLLISPDYIDSDECWNIDIKRALERHKEEKAVVILILLRHVDYSKAAFSALPLLPKGGRPIASWSDRDQAFMQIAQEIRRIVESFKKTGRISWTALGIGAAILTLGTLGTVALASQVQRGQAQREQEQAEALRKINDDVKAAWLWLITLLIVGFAGGFLIMWSIGLFR
jgi:hypothetical protein